MERHYNNGSVKSVWVDQRAVHVVSGLLLLTFQPFKGLFVCLMQA